MQKDDVIYRQAAIDAICAVCGNDCDKSEFVYNAPQDEQVILCPEHYCLCTLPSAQPGLPFEIQDILDYLDTVLHPIISPDHWSVYAELHDMISTLPAAQPEIKMDEDMISRQAALDAVEESRRENHHKNGKEACCHEYEHRHFLKILHELPSAQPERKTGRWIYGEDDVAMCDGYHCSECGFFVPWDYKRKSIDFIKDYNFCPNCGSPMLKEGEG